MHNPNPINWTLKDSLSHDLLLHKHSNICLCKFSNVDYIGYPINHHSTDGYLIYLETNLVSWSSKKQPNIVWALKLSINLSRMPRPNSFGSCLSSMSYEFLYMSLQPCVVTTSTLPTYFANSHLPRHNKTYQNWLSFHLGTSHNK